MSDAGWLIVVGAHADEQTIDDAQQLRRQLQTAGDADVAMTSDPDELTVALRAHEELIPVVVGGDGSLRLVLDHLQQIDRDRTPTVALLPRGTGNDLATTLQLAVDVEEAASAIIDSHTRPMDLLRANSGLIACNAAHTGSGVAAAEAGEDLKGELGSFAYAVGAIRTVRNPVTIEVEVTADGVDFLRGELAYLGVHLLPTIGGGVPMAPDADPDEPRAQVVAIHAGAEPTEILAGLRLLRRGEHLDHPAVRQAKARRIDIDGSDLTWNIDGDLFETGSPINWAVDRDAWRLVVSRASNTD